ncbi:hypothetical protein GOB94_15555 [Granulicella sp. 5B5]|uniref:hypothetical protein n=1 Tax=Granulicella sp. 5B5 TaxID=1617967 RepID=UPI0015F43865|nr:hypothetical protein [Granulicella sp. 5B5]QMV19938.1 hypothetical protein GOB94_15555 [Granulicella sp. 5B5]
MKVWVSAAAIDPSVVELRSSLALFASKRFKKVGDTLHVVGYIAGTDRKTGVSPFGYGSDETVAVSMLLRIASELTGASAELFTTSRCYAASALLRQMVEVEYLAWAFESRDKDAEQWIRSNDEERQDFFRPAKLRKASQGRFRGKDYGYHCDRGGHPTPRASILLTGDPANSQLLLSDLLGHVGRIWNHIVGWAIEHEENWISEYTEEMASKFEEWKARDLLVKLPPPP